MTLWIFLIYSFPLSPSSESTSTLKKCVWVHMCVYMVYTHTCIFISIFLVPTAAAVVLVKGSSVEKCGHWWTDGSSGNGASMSGPSARTISLRGRRWKQYHLCTAWGSASAGRHSAAQHSPKVTAWPCDPGSCLPPMTVLEQEEGKETQPRGPQAGRQYHTTQFNFLFLYSSYKS